MQAIPAKWRRIIQAIPGYDPIATAGDCRFDCAAAQRALDFFPEYLTHIKGRLAGTPLVLVLWEQSIVANIIGWKRPDGTRRYREAFILVPRKNGKTTLAAGLTNFILFCDREPGAEIYSAAADRNQASLVFEPAAMMVRNQPALSARATVYQAVKSIVLKDNSGSYKPLSADAFSKHGYNVHLAVVDEVHVQPNRELVDVLRRGTGARSQPLMFYITTADYDRPSVCNELRDYAEKVRDGVVEDETFLPVLYAAEADEDWTSEKVWRKANPNLGVSLPLEYLRGECRRAIESAVLENAFRRYHLNQKTEQAVRWIRLASWDACGDLPGNLDGRPCYAGLDMSSTRDLTAFVLYFPEDHHAIVPMFFVPQANAVARERRDRVPYTTWARQGHIEMIPGDVIDHDVIIRRITEAGARYDIREVAVDRWETRQVETTLARAGFNVVPFGQGFASMSAPSKRLDVLITSGALRHGGHPVLRWCASNVAVEIDGPENIKPSKKKSTERIDGITGLVMALGRAMEADPDANKSVYDDRGIREWE